MSKLDPTQPHLPLVFNNRYQVERELGCGGMSIVYLARDLQLLNKHVVVKVLLDESQKDPYVRQVSTGVGRALTRHPSRSSGSARYRRRLPRICIPT